ncbi:MAG: ABC transporter ATP-binding protein [Armatimonadetes bacterium]|nr:ABC transporter ATP-binding protein [Armatimonadota bacterium]
MRTMTAIELTAVVTGYDPAAPVLRGVSFGLGAGEFLAVIGPNGSGKTTLLRVLAGVLPVAEGEVLISGRPLHRWKRRELARHMAVVPQMSVPPFAYTVREFVSFGRNPYLPPWAAPRPADVEAVNRSLRLARLQTLADKPVTALSGGEYQRAALARALAQQPQILLLDEPTAFLDPAHAVGMLGLVERLNAEGLTVIAVFHDLNLAATYSRRVLALREGQVFADGGVEDVLRRPLLEELYSTPMLVDAGPGGRPRITLLKTEAGP